METLSDTTSKPAQTQKSTRKTNVVIILLSIITVLSIAGLGFLYYQYKLSQDQLAKFEDPKYLSTLQEDATKSIIEKVESHMLLPDEDPTVATITDADALRKENAEFYKEAKNGDVLLIFTTKAILYRTSSDRIINVAPVFIEPSDDTTNTDTEADKGTDTTE